MLDDHLYTNKQLRGAAKRKASLHDSRQARKIDVEEEEATTAPRHEPEQAPLAAVPVVEAISLPTSAKIPIPALNRVKSRTPIGFPCDQCDKASI